MKKRMSETDFCYINAYHKDREDLIVFLNKNLSNRGYSFSVLTCNEDMLLFCRNNNIPCTNLFNLPYQDFELEFPIEIGNIIFRSPLDVMITEMKYYYCNEFLFESYYRRRLKKIAGKVKTFFKMQGIPRKAFITKLGGEIPKLLMHYFSEKKGAKYIQFGAFPQLFSDRCFFHEDQLLSLNLSDIPTGNEVQRTSELIHQHNNKPEEIKYFHGSSRKGYLAKFKIYLKNLNFLPMIWWLNKKIYEGFIQRFKKNFIKKIQIEERDLNEDFILLPLQTINDAQITIRNREFIDQTKAVERLRSEFPEEKIIVKLHPGIKGLLSVNEIRKIQKINNIDIVLDSISTAKLIEKTKFTAIINTTVGFESYIKQKPVYVMGEWNMPKYEGIFSKPEMFASEEINKDAMLKNVAKIYSNMNKGNAYGVTDDLKGLVDSLIQYVE